MSLFLFLVVIDILVNIEGCCVLYLWYLVVVEDFVFGEGEG